MAGHLPEGPQPKQAPDRRRRQNLEESAPSVRPPVMLAKEKAALPVEHWAHPAPEQGLERELAQVRELVRGLVPERELVRGLELVREMEPERVPEPELASRKAQEEVVEPESQV